MLRSSGYKPITTSIVDNMTNEQEIEIRQARSCFFAMAATYFLGVFNDNYFKQAVLLLAVAAGLSGLQGQATELFSLPFILFSAYGGWLADRFAKKHVVIGVKFLELVAMMIGAYGILTLNWNCVLAMVFLMGLQSTLFGPALNGSIPELYPKWYVTKANAILKLVTTIAILLGMAIAGFALDQDWINTSIPFGNILIAVSVIIVSLFGVITSFGIHYREPVAKRIPFPWAGPLMSIKDSILLKNDKLLLLAVFCDVFFYFISLLAILVINTLGLQELAYTKSATSILSVSLMVGVCLGSFLASKITSHEKWTHVLAPGAIGMGICLVLAGYVASMTISFQFGLILLVLACVGTFGGLFLIPVASFIQVRPKAGSKGRIIAVANFLAFIGMWCSGRLFTTLDTSFQSSLNLKFLGICSVIIGGCIYSLLLYIKKQNGK